MQTVYSPLHCRHDPAEVVAAGFVLPDGDPFESNEIPQRAELIRTAILAAGLGPIVMPVDHGMTPILRVHTEDYVGFLQTAYDRNAAYAGVPCPVMAGRSGVDPHRAAQRPDDFPALRDYYTFDYEDPILAGTWEAAYWSAQCALTAADLVHRGARSAYALSRPPGHHAMPDQYGGFCYLNNAAIAARLASAWGTVAILDVDYHHGNGTQAIFYTDPGVLYVSLHVDPAVDYPYYWGFSGEVGAAGGLGTNVNLPLPIGADDAAYLAALEIALQRIVDFRPDALVVSLGLDAVEGDTIGKFALTPAGWSEVGRRVAALDMPTILVQEGGYRLETLGQNAVGFLQHLR